MLAMGVLNVLTKSPCIYSALVHLRRSGGGGNTKVSIALENVVL